MASKFVLWQTRYYNLLTEKKDKKIFSWYTSGKFYIVKFNYLSGRPNKVKKSFEIFLIDHYAGDIGNKNIAGKY